jgi:hypothetical protein
LIPVIDIILAFETPASFKVNACALVVLSYKGHSVIVCGQYWLTLFYGAFYNHMVISPVTTYQLVSWIFYSCIDIAQTLHRHHTDMCSMCDVGKITSKPHSVGGLEIQLVVRATRQEGSRDFCKVPPYNKNTISAKTQFLPPIPIVIS